MAEDKNVPENENNEGREDKGGASEEKQEKKGAFTQDDVNRIISERLEREREKQPSREDIEREVRESIEAEIRQEKAREEGDYETLVTELADKVTERDEQIKNLKEKLKEAQGTSQNTSERVEALESRLKGTIKPQLERIPEMFRGFVEEKSVEEQAAWLEKNAEKLQGPQDPIGSPETPRAANNKNRTKEQDKEVAEQQRRQAFSAV